MSDDFQYEPLAKEGEAFRDSAGVTHVEALVGEHLVGFCGASLEDGEQAFEDDIDCMTCIVERERFAAEVLR